MIVESPAKAKTIQKYLGDGYTVLPTIGHIRELPKKDAIRLTGSATAGTITAFKFPRNK